MKLKTLEWWISKLMLDPLFFLLSRQTYLSSEKYYNSTNQNREYEADKFKILRAIKRLYTKWEELYF